MRTLLCVCCYMCFLPLLYAQNNVLNWGEPLTASAVAAIADGPDQLAFRYDLEIIQTSGASRLVYYAPRSYLIINQFTANKKRDVSELQKSIEVKFDLFHLRNLKLACLYNGFYSPASLNERVRRLNAQFAELELRMDSLFESNFTGPATIALADSIQKTVHAEAQWKPAGYIPGNWRFAPLVSLGSHQLNGTVHKVFRSHLLFIVGGTVGYKMLNTKLEFGFGTSYTTAPGYWPIEAFKPLKQHSVFLLNHTLGYTFFDGYKLSITPNIGYSLLTFSLTEPEEAPPVTDHSYPKRQLLGYTAGVDLGFSLLKETDFTSQSIFNLPVKTQMDIRLIAGVNYSQYHNEISGTSLLFKLGVQVATRSIKYSPEHKKSFAVEL